VSDASQDKPKLPPGPDARDIVVNAAGELVGEVEDLVGRPLYPVSFYASEVDEHLLRGSWPDQAGLAALKARGVGLVINLCSERSNDEDVLAAGMVPRSIPIEDNTVPTEFAVQQFIAFMAAARDLTRAPLGRSALGLVFVHCEKGAGRTGCMVSAYRVLRCGWTPAAALEEAERFGLGMPDQKAWILALGGP
jgi:hypothetical protein